MKMLSLVTMNLLVAERAFYYYNVAITASTAPAVQRGLEPK